MKIINIEEASKYSEDIKEMLKTERHHNHEIVETHGTYRWKENEEVSKLNVNDVVSMLVTLGYDKNSEVYRKYYRDLGYSLYGYCEIFYWQMNNEYASDYNPMREYRDNKLNELLK